MITVHESMIKTLMCVQNYTYRATLVSFKSIRLDSFVVTLVELEHFGIMIFATISKPTLQLL